MLNVHQGNMLNAHQGNMLNAYQGNALNHSAEVISWKEGQTIDSSLNSCPIHL